MKKTLIAALLGASLLGGAAWAQDGGQQRGRDPLARADANGDGIVTRDEVMADVAARFAKLDTNGDGKISAEERQAVAEARMARRGDMGPPPPPPGGEMAPPPGGPGGGRGMQRLDTDGDGMISLAEQQAQATRRFDRVDTNHDGKIDQAERAAIPARGRRGRGGDMPPPSPPADAPGN